MLGLYSVRDVVVSARYVSNAWTAGQRQNPNDRSSPFVWRLASANDYRELPVNFTSWSSGEPHRDLCIGLFRAGNNMWFDAACNNAYNAVCEIRVA